MFCTIIHQTVNLLIQKLNQLIHSTQEESIQSDDFPLILI